MELPPSGSPDFDEQMRKAAEKRKHAIEKKIVGELLSGTDSMGLGKMGLTAPGNLASSGNVSQSLAWATIGNISARATVKRDWWNTCRMLGHDVQGIVRDEFQIGSERISTVIAVCWTCEDDRLRRIEERTQ